MPDGAISFPLLGDGYINPSKYLEIGGFRVHWYGIIIAAGLILAVVYCHKRAHEFGISGDNLLDLVIYGLPTAIICARIYYVVFYWELYEENFSDVFKIWNGGLGFYGGLFGAILVGVVYTRAKKISLPATLDLASQGFLIGQFIGRWGNFMNREAYGYITEVPWRMGITSGGVTNYYHPTFLYESLWNFAGFIIIHFLSKKRKYDGQVALYYAAWYGLGRMIIEGLRTDSLMVFNTGIRVSHLVAGVSFIAGTALLLLNRYKFKHDPEDMYVNRLRRGVEKTGDRSEGEGLSEDI